MASVTQRIKEITQPKGGYLSISKFKQFEFEDDELLEENENLHPSIIGLAVDYLSRFMINKNKEKSFDISLIGIECAKNFYKFACKSNHQNLQIIKIKFNFLSQIDNIRIELLNDINGLDDKSIIAACKLVSYDVWYRNLEAALKTDSQTYSKIANQSTINNIKIMVNRFLNFNKSYGPIIADGFNFKPSGYTDIIGAGDGDFLTYNTLWDLKVIKSKPTIDYTLQILIYWIMGKHSTNPLFNQIDHIGIFNPRLNTMYRISTSIIKKEIIKEIEQKVIGYK